MKLSAPPVVNHYEIERRVAVEAMGLPAVEFNERTKCPYCGEVGRMTIGRIWCCNCYEWYYHPYKNYRDSLDDAMVVIDKMRADGLSVDITANSEESSDHEWGVVLRRHGRRAGEMHTGHHSSLATAICLAVLAAVEGKLVVQSAEYIGEE